MGVIDTNLITRYKGDTYAIEAILTKGGTPLNFTAGNNTARFSFARGTIYENIAGINGTASGEIHFPFPADVSAGTYSYDIQVTANTGEIQTYIKNTLEIVNDVTK